MMRRAIAMGLAVAITLANVARADEPRPTKDAIRADLHSYYGGERASAYIVAVLGALSIGGGSVLVTRDSDFARGFGWPLILLGALEGLGAIVYAFQVGAEIHHYDGALDRDAATYRTEELAHIHGTRARFVFYRLAELGLFLGGVGCATYGFVANSDTWKGIGIGVGSIAIPFLLIDTINNGRAIHYEEQVKAFDAAPAHAAAVPVLPATPFYLSYAGRF